MVPEENYDFPNLTFSDFFMIFISLLISYMSNWSPIDSLEKFLKGFKDFNSRMDSAAKKKKISRNNSASIALELFFADVLTYGQLAVAK